MRILVRCISIERNEVIMERETELTADNIEDIVESGAQTVLLHKEQKLPTRLFNHLQYLAEGPK